MNSQQLLEWLLWNEGYKPKSYLDSLGNQTIGIGFLLSDPTTHGKSSLIRNTLDGLLGVGTYNQIYGAAGRALSPSEIFKLYNYSIQQALNTVNSLYPNFANFSNAQQIVLIDLAFNMGYTKLY